MENTCPVCGEPRVEGASSCPTCGFRFFEATQQLKPVSVSFDLPEVQGDTSLATLKVVKGPNTGISYELNRTITTIGRNPGCDVFLNDMTVSREHALIAASENGYVITDRKSYNGLWINNQPVERKTLDSGDLIQIGKFCLLFEC